MRYLAVFLLASTTAFAADARLIDFNAALQLPEGGDVTECAKWSDATPPKCLGEKPLTLGLVAYRSLMTTKPGSSINDIADRWKLQRRVLKGPQELSAAEVTTLVNAIHDFNPNPQQSGGGWSTEVIGQTACMLDATYCPK